MSGAFGKKPLETECRLVSRNFLPRAKSAQGIPFARTLQARTAANGGARFRISRAGHLRASAISVFGIAGFPFSVTAADRICIKGVTRCTVLLMHSRLARACVHA